MSLPSYDSFESAIEQIKKCAFECEGGPLELNAGWIWLTADLINRNQ